MNLESDLAEIFEAVANGNLAGTPIAWKDGASACVILAAENYPGSPKKGDVIEGLEVASKHENTVIFHAGTSENEQGEFVTAGGRVLAVTAIGSNLSSAIHRAYKTVNEIEWDGMQFRRDIGK